MRSVKTVAATQGNELLTSATAAVLTLLLIAEGITILWMGGLRTEHMFIGLVLIPPVLLKLGSTGYRFVRYYTGASGYRAKGPPALPLRVLAPVLVAATIVVFASGVALLVLEHRSDALLEIHKVAFIVWGAVFAVHFVSYLPRVWRAFAESRRDRAPGGLVRGLLVSASLGGGVTLAVALLSVIEAWRGR
ncbi:MAG TPA: hypothetical protein VFX51_21660 [Solirubrobacteraceae bacterium]|nr:hypothetical protein [Solirubrobacteraceae bacterium]